MTFLNQSQFAKHIGKHKTHVTQLKQQGRLVMSDDGKKVDVEASIKRIEETKDGTREDVVERIAAEKNADASATEKQPVNHDLVLGDDPTKTNLSKGKAVEQHYKALRAQIDYKVLIGELVSKSDIENALQDMVITFRQGLENLPHLLAPTLVNKDIDFIRASLRASIEDSLNELGRTCKKLLDERSTT